MICKYFKKSDEGVCVNYKGNELNIKRSCSYDCSKIKRKGSINNDDMEVIVE